MERDAVSDVLSDSIAEQFDRDGYRFPLAVMSGEEAAYYRGCLEAYEARTGGPINGVRLQKPHLLFTWASEIIHRPQILDAVEEILGPDILCWNADFIIKKAHDPHDIGWHQDWTYWGLDPPDVLTAWLALNDATVENGAMKFMPGSHRLGQLPHVETMRELNVTGRKQEVLDVDESRAVDAPLAAGEVSLHHIGLLHASKSNTTSGRRIGLAIRYMAGHVRQIRARESAMLMRGEDRFGHFDLEPNPVANLDAAALEAHGAAMDISLKNYYGAEDKAKYGK